MEGIEMKLNSLFMYLKLIFLNQISIKNFSKNVLELKKCKIRKSKIKIDGEKNKLKISKNSKIKNTTIILKGKNIILEIGKNVKILDSFIEIYGDNNKLFPFKISQNI